MSTRRVLRPGSAVLAAAASTTLLACPAPGGEPETTGTSDVGASDGTASEATSDTASEATTGGAAACPFEPPPSPVFMTAWTGGAEGGFGHGNRDCIVDAVELAGGVLNLGLSCTKQMEPLVGPTHVTVSASPPVSAHPFVAGEAVHLYHFDDSGNFVARLERLDGTVLLHAERGAAATDEPDLVQLGAELCDRDDPCGRLVFHRLEIDPGDGAFEVQPWSHAQHGAYSVWTGAGALLVKDRSCVAHALNIEALVLRDAP